MSTDKKSSFSHLGAGTAGLLVLLVILGAVYVLATNLRIRMDLTADKLYTLTNGTRDILGQLEQGVVLKYYFSESSPEMPMGMKQYAAKVRDLLKEYEIAAKGRITLEAHDPRPDSDAEEWAQRYGVEPQQVNPFGQPVYFGLVAVGSEREAVLPGFSPRMEATLEYDITRLITRVAWPDKPVIGVMSSLPVFGAPPNPMMMQRPREADRGWMAIRELRRDYVVRQIPDHTDRIDADIKTLVVIHPKALGEATLFAIDQFVLRGGRLIAFVDPFSVADLEANPAQNPMMMMPDADSAGPSTLGPLFEAWGVRFDTTQIVTDLRASTKLNAGDGRVEDNPAFLSLGRDHLNADDLLTAQLSEVMMPFAGAFRDETPDAITFTPLITTSADEASLVDAMRLQFGMEDIRRNLRPDGIRRTLAVRLQGTFPTAFPEGIGDDETDPAAEHLQQGRGTVVLFGDADMLQDRFCVQVFNTLFGTAAQPFNDNLSLFANTVEQLAGMEALIGVRSRGRLNRPFKKVDALEVAATRRWQAEEARLEADLMETQQRLADLQRGKGDGERLILSREQQAEIEQFRVRQAETRRELINVRKNLTRDIERLGTRLKMINIGLMPLAIAIFGIVRGVRRKRR